MPIVAITPAAKAPVEAKLSLPTCSTPDEAVGVLLEQLLNSAADGASDTVIVRALGEEMPEIRSAALKAGIRMAEGPGSARAKALLGVFEDILDHPPADRLRAERVTGAVLAMSGCLGKSLDQEALAGMLSRYMPLLRDASPTIADGASRGMANALRGALASGNAALDGEVRSLLTTSMQTVSGAKRSEDSRGGAGGVGACISAAGASSLEHFGVMATLAGLIGGRGVGAEAPHAREAAVLTVEQLSVHMGEEFEPYGVPLLRELVALYADKDKKVADAAAKAVRAMLSRLSTPAIKLVLPALYDGMEAVQWRTKVECLGALATLAAHAPASVGPRLPVAIPKVMECLANTNSKVVEAASEALPVLCSCVQNSETQKLKPLLIEAYINPDRTLHCVEELMSTTFVNAMDGTSLAFIMPLLLRALKDP